VTDRQTDTEPWLYRIKQLEFNNDFHFGYYRVRKYCSKPWRIKKQKKHRTFYPRHHVMHRGYSVYCWSIVKRFSTLFVTRTPHHVLTRLSTPSWTSLSSVSTQMLHCYRNEFLIVAEYQKGAHVWSLLILSRIDMDGLLNNDKREQKLGFVTRQCQIFRPLARGSTWYPLCLRCRWHA